MHNLSRAFAACCMSVAMLAPNAYAIEPQAPEQLITAEEAAVISLRQRVAEVRAPSKPTQTEKGEMQDRAGLLDHYGSTDGGLIWVDDNGLNAKARAVIEEMTKARDWGLDPDAFDPPSDVLDAPDDGLTADQRVNLEMQMSLTVLKYARHARGGRMDPKDLSLDIDREPPLLRGRDVLGAIAATDDPAAYLRDLHPKHDQFVKLRKAYLKALQDEADGIDTRVETEEAKPAKKGKKRRKARKRRSQVKLSQRILYNMEMWRWMPAELGDTYVLPNVPEYRIRVIKDGNIIHSERMIVGKVKNKTPIFSDELEHVVFHPFWGVPNSIKVKELLPKLMRGSGLERQGLRMRLGSREVDPRSVDWGRTDIRNYHVYQPPGARNALGVVKFMFPNKHAVYFHDTPSKYLFKKKTRAYSHGCMRVRNPLKMAEVLFKQDRGWGMSKIRSIVDNGPDNNQIKLNRKIPVHVSYFTARVDEDGELRLVKDLYGHEKRIQIGLDGKAHTIVKEDRSLEKYVPRRTRNVANSGGGFFSGGFGGSSSQGRSSAWKRSVFGNQ